MVVLNLSEQYRRNNSLGIIDRIQLFFDLEVYHANSFEDIERHFDNNPPKKRGIFDLPTATVIMEDVGIRRYRNDYYFDDNNPEHLKALDDVEHFPAFEITDSKDTRVAFFGGTTADYLRDMNRYGLTKNSHATIPVMRLQYTELSPQRIIMIKSLGITENEVRGNLLERMVRKNDRIESVRY